MSDRSELAEAARRCEQALIAARRAAFNAELEPLADALEKAANAQADTAEILERVPAPLDADEAARMREALAASDKAQAERRPGYAN